MLRCEQHLHSIYTAHTRGFAEYCNYITSRKIFERNDVKKVCPTVLLPSFKTEFKNLFVYLCGESVALTCHSFLECVYGECLLWQMEKEGLDVCQLEEEFGGS